MTPFDSWLLLGGVACLCLAAALTLGTVLDYAARWLRRWRP